MNECKHDLNSKGVCDNCGMGAIWIVANQSRKIGNLTTETIRLNKMANYYRHKCKVYGGVLSSDGPAPSDHDLELLKQLEPR